MHWKADQINDGTSPSASAFLTGYCTKLALEALTGKAGCTEETSA
jgi:hypothetical protein